MLRNHRFLIPILLLSILLVGCKTSGGGSGGGGGSGSAAIPGVNNPANSQAILSSSTQANAPIPSTNIPNSTLPVDSGKSSAPVANLDFLPLIAKASIPPELAKDYAALKSQSLGFANIDKIDLPHYQISMDHRISEMMHGIMQNRGVSNFPAFMACGFDTEMGSLAASSNTKVQYALQRGGNICFKLHQPEGYFLKDKIFSPGIFNMLTLQNVLETAVTAPMLQNIPFSFFDVPTTQSIRSAMLRIKFSVLTLDLNDFLARMDSALTDGSISAIDKQNLLLMKQATLSKISELNRWNDAGKAALTADNLAVAKQRKLRGALPYNNLPDTERKSLTMYASAMMWRLRGGGF